MIYELIKTRGNISSGMIKKAKARLISGFTVGVKEFNEKHRAAAGITTFFSLIIITLISVVFGIADLIRSLLSGLFRSKKRIIGVILAALLILLVTLVKVFTPSQALKNTGATESVAVGAEGAPDAQTAETNAAQLAQAEVERMSQTEKVRTAETEETESTQAVEAENAQAAEAEKAQTTEAESNQTTEAEAVQTAEIQAAQTAADSAVASQSAATAENTSASQGADTAEKTDYDQDTLPPISIEGLDIDEYIKEHPGTVGWVYFEDGHISYPIVQGSDNEMYTVLGYDGKEARTGAVFLDYRSSADFSDANSIVYGHNMKDGTMFGSLREYREDPHYYDDHQYYQIILPGKTYRYQIFEYMDVPESYELYGYVGDAALAFVKDAEPVRIKSYMDSEIVVNETKKVVTLSTCTKKDDLQFVVLGVLVEETEE